MAGAESLGTGSIPKLLWRQALPASVGILFMTLNLLVDTILTGRWIGPLAIAALAVVTPVSFLIGSVGFAIGNGGTSVLSRAIGAGHDEKATATFAHQVMMTLLLCGIFVAAGLLFPDFVLSLFGAKGHISAPARLFYYPILIASPLQALAIVCSGVMRAEDRARMAMLALIIPSVANIGFDVLFIRVLGWGIFGSALATALSFLSAFLYCAWFFAFRSAIKLRLRHFSPDWKLTGEIAALSVTTFARQSVISILSVLLNHALFKHGGELGVAMYGIISRMLMFALFPVNGITEGFLPVAGYNYGAKKFSRVREIVFTAIRYASILAIGIYAVILFFAPQIIASFTHDAAVVARTPNALRWVFAASPVIAVQLIGAAYFQAAGQAKKAILLTLSKQGFFLIPLILILPDYFGIFGIWAAFPVADVLATIVTGCFLWRELRTKLSA